CLSSISLLCLSSFLSRFPYTPLLLSFPTRRSSDLLEDHGHLLGRCGDLSAVEADRAGGRGEEPREALEQGRLAAARGPDDAHELDRKSTRLNSSHVKISYAVFCLKKKKTT